MQTSLCRNLSEYPAHRIIITDSVLRKDVKSFNRKTCHSLQTSPVDPVRAVQINIQNQSCIANSIQFIFIIMDTRFVCRPAGTKMMTYRALEIHITSDQSCHSSCRFVFLPHTIPRERKIKYFIPSPTVPEQTLTNSHSLLTVVCTCQTF